MSVIQVLGRQIPKAHCSASLTELTGNLRLLKMRKSGKGTQFNLWLLHLIHMCTLPREHVHIQCAHSYENMYIEHTLRPNNPASTKTMRINDHS